MRRALKLMDDQVMQLAMGVKERSSDAVTVRYGSVANMFHFPPGRTKGYLYYKKKTSSTAMLSKNNPSIDALY